MSTLDDAFQFSKNFAKNAYKGGMQGVRGAYDSAKALGQAPTENIAGATTPTSTPVASPPVTPGSTPPSQPTPGPTVEPVGVRPTTTPGPQPYKPNFTMPDGGPGPTTPTPGANPNVGAAGSAEARAFQAAQAEAQVAQAARTAGTATAAAAEAAPAAGLAARAAAGVRGAVAVGSKAVPAGALLKTAALAGGAYSAYNAIDKGEVDGGDALGLAGGVMALPIPGIAKAAGLTGIGALYGGKKIYDQMTDGAQNAIGGTLKTIAANGIFGFKKDQDAQADLDADFNTRMGGDPRLPVTKGNAPNPNQANLPTDGPLFGRPSTAAAAVPGAPGSAAGATPDATATAAPLSVTDQESQLRSTLAKSPGLDLAGDGSVVDRGSAGLRTLASNPAALSQFNDLQTARGNGIRATVNNGRVAFSNDGSGTPAPTSGIDLNAANAISARANAIRASTPAENDPNALFSGAPSTGPATDLTLGGAIGRRVQRDQVQQRLAAQEFGLRARVADQTALHNAQTNQIAAGQLQRQLQHDQATLDESARKTNLEFGEGSIGRQRLKNEQSEHVDKLAGEAESKLTTDLQNTLPPGPDGKPDSSAVQSYLSDLRATAAARSSEARKAGNTQLADRYDKAKLAAFSDADIERYKVGKQIKELARSSRGSGPGSSTFVDSDDLKGYATLAKDQPNNLLFPDQVKLANGTVIPKTLLTRTNNPNIYLPNTDAGSPRTNKFTNQLGLRSN